ncbi:Rpn family recombination-promoting nuclease/putative transposase [Hydrogenibacillus sp. N12]|nr:Rpn family recombination-promoting nuclease/putative transposase [Hydrogenibacillus sp. N12]
MTSMPSSSGDRWEDDLFAQESPRDIHDRGYKYLLSSKRTFVQLLRSFVRSAWVADIDETRLERLDKSYVLPDFREKEADLVYRLVIVDQNNDGTPIERIFYVLLEHQSTVDPQMPYRLLVYLLEIWRDHLKNVDPRQVARRNFRLPPIVPIVLYNGRPMWTAPRRFRDLIDADERFGPELVDFEYILIDVHRYRDEELQAVANLMAAVFFIDRVRQPDEIRERLRALVAMLVRLTPDERRAFFRWLATMLRARFLDQARTEELSWLEGAFDRLLGEEEEAMVTNFERVLDEAFRREREQGRRAGLEEGRRAGLEEGRRQTARRLLERGLDEALVAEVTELSIEEVRRLRAALRSESGETPPPSDAAGRAD